MNWILKHRRNCVSTFTRNWMQQFVSCYKIGVALNLNTRLKHYMKTASVYYFLWLVVPQEKFSLLQIILKMRYYNLFADAVPNCDWGRLEQSTS